MNDFNTKGQKQRYILEKCNARVSRAAVQCSWRHVFSLPWQADWINALRRAAIERAGHAVSVILDKSPSLAWRWRLVGVISVIIDNLCVESISSIISPQRFQFDVRVSRAIVCRDEVYAVNAVADILHNGLDKETWQSLILEVPWQGSRSTLAQIMACCLTASSHYLNQCWLMISEVLWHSPDSNFTENT